MKHLTDTSSLGYDDIESLLERATFYIPLVESSEQDAITIRSKGRVALCFFEPSTRTRVSFETACMALGYQYVLFQTNASSIEKGETDLDTLYTLRAMGYRTLIIRHAENGFIGKACSIPDTSIVNAGEGTRAHPTQALLDASALRERTGDISGLKICIVGDIRHSRVARSQRDVFTRMGADLSWCAPDNFAPTEPEWLDMHRYEGIDEALKHTNVLSMLRIQNERLGPYMDLDLPAYRTAYALTAERAVRNSKVIVLHPGPVNYGVEIDHEVMDMPGCLIRRQVTHGVAIRIALLSALGPR